MKLRFKGAIAFLFLFALLFAATLPLAPAYAETRYAKPAMEIIIRESQSIRSKIVATVNLAEPVELLDGNNEWSRVKVANGASGWVRTRNLSKAPFVPTEAFQPGSVSGKVLMDAEAAFKEVNAANSQLKQELASCTTDRNTLEDKYTTLTNDPDSILHTRNSLEDARTQLGEVEEKLAQAQIENKALKMNQSIMWFLAGGGALFLGWLIGRFSGSGRKKRTSLY
ncbi:MAG: TIGR04211 family SH3 domain-containing protein [bacterium]|nr:TIGR04211 family SH3 domain-containing protein [bacterium]